MKIRGTLNYGSNEMERTQGVYTVHVQYLVSQVPTVAACVGIGIRCDIFVIYILCYMYLYYYEQILVLQYQVV